MKPITLDFSVPGVPPRILSPNGRGHWAQKDRARLEQEHDWRYAIRDMLTDQRPPRVLRGPVRCQITVYRRRRGGVWDGDNLLAAMKAGIDELETLEVIANDQQLRFEPIKQEIDPDDRGYVYVELTEIEG